MIQDFMADVKKCKAWFTRLKERSAALQQELDDVKALVNEGDSDFDASMALVADIVVAIEDQEAELVDFEAEVDRLDERQEMISDRLKKYE